MLGLLLALHGGLQLSGDYTSLLEAQRRRSSNARAAFSAAVRDPIHKDPNWSPLELVSLIAAEEHCADVSLMPHHVSSRIRSEIEQLVAPAAQRLALDKAMGSEVKPEVVCASVATALFGTKGAPDDADGENDFFTPLSRDPLTMPDADLAAYYDPANLFLDRVLERRQGVPLAVSIVAADACSQLGVPMVGLATPSAVLLAPAQSPPPPSPLPAQDGDDASPPPASPSAFVLDCSTGTGVLTEDEAACSLAAELCDVTGASEEKVLAYGRVALRQLRASPLTALQWGASVLRSLRDAHEEEEDVVRLLGVCDRLRLIGSVSRLAVSDEESREYAGQVALCIYTLKWEQRRNEARILLRGLLRFADEEDGVLEERMRMEALLQDPWFADAVDEQR